MSDLSNKDPKDRIIKNTFALFAGNATVNLLSFLLMVVIARCLGDVGVGQYSFIFAFGYLIILLGNPGLEYLIVKDVPGNDNFMPQYGANILSLKAVSSIIAVAITFSLTFFIDKSPAVIHSLFIVCIIYGVNVVGSTFTKILHANERMGLTSLAEVAERGIALILGAILLYLTRSLLYLVLALLLSRLIRELLCFIFSRKYFTPRFGFEFRLWKRLFIKSLPFTLSIAFLYIYYRIDTVMLSLMVNDQVTGWYNAAYRLIDVVNYIPFLIVTAILSPMARSSKRDRELLADIFNRSLRYLVLLSIPIGVGIFMLSQRIIFFVFGGGFENAALALKILIWAEVIVFVNYLCGHLLNVIDKQKIFTKIIGITAGGNIILNFILIPKYTFVGAGVATLLSEILIFILMFYFIKKYFVKMNLLAFVWRPVLASLVMAIIILHVDFLPLWYVMPIGAVSYFIFFLLLGGFNEHDKDLVYTLCSMIGFKKV